jgi:dihydroorotase
MTKTSIAESLYVKGAHILDPSQKWNKMGDLLIVKGKVVGIGKPGEFAKKAKALKAKEIDAKGLFLSPGFVDLNCAIYEPGSEQVEGFASGSRAAAAGGFTSLLIKPFTTPVHDNAFITDFVFRRAKENSIVRIFAMGALTSSREGKKLSEMGAMAAAGVKAVGDGIAITDTYLMRKALEYAQAFFLPVFSFPEDRLLAGQGLMNEGWNSNRLGLRGIPSAAEEIAVHRDLVLARHTHGRLHIQPISTAGSIEAIRAAKKAGLKVTTDTSAPYFQLTSDAIASYDANYKVFPPLRSDEDREAIVNALKDGTIDAISSFHTPQSRVSKAQSFENASAGMIGLETTFHHTIELVHRKKISPMRLVELLSSAPAKILGIEKEVGSLKIGCNGDFVLFDSKGSSYYEESNCKSAARNSPFFGQKLKGKIHSTYVGGTLVHSSRGNLK